MKVINTRAELAALAKELGLRPDWHEPDNQSVTAVFGGDSFDNAMPPGHSYGGTAQPHAEMHITLYRTEWNNALGRDLPVEPLAVVNLATLFAWAAEQ